LEKGKHGFCFSSGLGATTAITALLEAGDHFVVGDDLYGGTNRYIQKCLSKQGVKYTFVDMTNVQNITDAIQPNTKVNRKQKNYLDLLLEFNISYFKHIIYFLISYQFISCIIIYSIVDGMARNADKSYDETYRHQSRR